MDRQRTLLPPSFFSLSFNEAEFVASAGEEEEEEEKIERHLSFSLFFRKDEQKQCKGRKKKESPAVSRQWRREGLRFFPLKKRQNQFRAVPPFFKHSVRGKTNAGSIFQILVL